MLNYAPRGLKKVLGDFLLNSKKGVKTPSWRTLGIKNDPMNIKYKYINKIQIFSLYNSSKFKKIFFEF